MVLHSKGLRTDVVMGSLESTIENLSDCVMIRTPALANYTEGQKIIFPEAPSAKASLNAMFDVYQAHFDTTVQSGMHLTWDKQPEGYVLPDIDIQAIEVTAFVVLSISTPMMSTASPEMPLPIRPVDWNHDLSAFVSLHLDPHNPKMSFEAQQAYWQVKALKLQQFQEIFQGQRWLMEQDRLVADVGIYAIKDIGRLHGLMVDRAFRQQGCASALIRHAVAHAQQQWHVQECILTAVKGSAIHRLSLSLGFDVIEERYTLTIPTPT